MRGRADGMIPCSEAVRSLWEYLDRGLSAEEAARVDDHLAFCRRCCGEMEFAKELRTMLRSHAEDEIPSDARRRLEAFLEEL